MLLAACVLLLASCAKDETETEIDKYLGDWVCKENPPQTFHIYITRRGNGDSLDVSNFSNLGNDYTALFIVNGNSVVIPSQDIGSSILYTISGSGTYSNDKINLTYKVDGENITAVCTQ